MPETPEELWQRAHADLRVPPVGDWDSWPFTGAIAPKELRPPVDAEPPRHGEGGVGCRRCAEGIDGAIWHDGNWMVRPVQEPGGLPCIVLLETRQHVDFPELDDELAAQLGPLMLRIERAVRAIDGVARVHIGRWGEGSEHFHLWFIARPFGFPQMASSFAEIWDGVLPPVPQHVWDANVAIVARELNA
jgi:hypothetical protein